MQSLSLFSLLRQARCMMEVPSLSHGVPAGCRGSFFERRNRYYVFNLRDAFLPVTWITETPPGYGRSARSALQRG